MAAALCFVGLVKLDLITIQPFSDHLDHSFLCGGGRHRFMPAAEFLSNLKPSGAGDFLKVAREFNHEYSQRGLLIIISDFLDDTDCIKPLQYLSDFGHELMLVHVWAEEDRVPPWDGELALEDAETGANLEISFDDNSRKKYTEAFDEYAALLRRLALRNGGRYAGLPTSLPVEEAMFGPMVTAGGLA